MKKTKPAKKRTAKMPRPSKMLVCHRLAYQGDVETEVIDTLPDDVVMISPVPAKLVVSKSAQGHDHYLVGAKKAYRSLDGMTTFVTNVSPSKPIVLVHDKADGHAPYRLGKKAGTIWRISVQRERLSNGGWGAVQD